MVNKHQFQLLAKAFRAGKISLSEFTEQAFNPPAESEPAKLGESSEESSSQNQVAK